MDSDLTEARYLAELGFLEDAVSEAGYQATLRETSYDLPHPTLVVELNPAHSDSPRQLMLTYYPVSDEDAGSLKYLQYFAAVTGVLDAAALERAAVLLPHVNARLVLGHFGISKSPAIVHFRYVQTLPGDELPEAEDVSDVLRLTQATLRLLAGVLADFAQGKLTLSEAQSQIAASYSADRA